MRIVPHPGKTVSGEILLKSNQYGRINLTVLTPFGGVIRSIRGKEISMIFQEPMTSLSPVHTIGNQIEEVILLHRTEDKHEARDLAVEMLGRVGLPNPSQRINEYPHQLSGGLRQRAMIAMALSCNPSLLIADEPTTALDVTVQAQILELMKELQEQFGMSVLYITHDLGVIAEICERVCVMYLGRIVESADTLTLFENTMHPYTELLLKSIPRLGKMARARLEVIEGTVPIPLDPPKECGFFSRCPKRMVGICDKEIPTLVEREQGHFVRCFLFGNEKVSDDE
jgi:oligopeptide/dipeptide ABC transporter ATP-binding protein